MKYSVLIPFYNREKEFRLAISSYAHWYGERFDYEILLGVDVKNLDRRGLFEIVDENPKIKFRIFETGSHSCYVPGPAFNYLAGKASGNILLLTNPETVHLTNVLGGIPDSIDGQYFVFSCEAGYVDDFSLRHPNIKYRHYMWYQHGTHNNRLLHFCSAISKKQYLDIGGFDEAYSVGIGYDDNDFLQKVVSGGICPVAVDSEVALHIEHDRTYNNSIEKTEANKAIYEKKWGIKLP